MSLHYRVYADFDGTASEKAFYVSSLPMARSAALQDGARTIYGIKEVKHNWLTQEYIGREYAMLLLRSIVFQIKAGAPPATATRNAIESEEDPSKRARLQGAMDALSRGAHISDALYATGLYDTTVRSILAAGERIGGGNAIASALEYLEGRKAVWKTYGVVVSALFFELSTALSVPPSIQWYAIPWIEGNLPNSSPEKLVEYQSQLATLATNNLIWMWLSGIGMAVAGGLFLLWMFEPRARDWLTQNILTKTPMIGDWYTNDALARSCKVFGSMLKAGVRMDDAIRTILRSSDNMVAIRFWKAASHELSTGSSHGVAFAAAGILRKDELFVLKTAQGNEQIANVFLEIASERDGRQKFLSARIFRTSIILMFVYIGITMLIGFRLFGLFNHGMEMTVNSMTQGF